MRTIIKTYLNEADIGYEEAHYEHWRQDFMIPWNRDERYYNIYIELDLRDRRIEMDYHYTFEIPDERIPETAELLHRLNEQNSYGRLILLWEKKMVIYRTDFFYPDSPEDQKAILDAYFTSSLKFIQWYELIIADVSHNDETPEKAIESWSGFI